MGGLDDEADVGRENETGRVPADCGRRAQRGVRGSADVAPFSAPCQGGVDDNGVELDLTRTLEHLLTADERLELENGPHADAMAR